MPDSKSPHALREENTLAFWKEKGIFEKSLGKESPKGEFVFYDGPPFATGLPHYGHILAGTIKDVIPRWKTMQGYRVRRRWGWDCHGLPVENIIEKEINLKSKKDIIDYGIGKFNAKARESVMRFADEWRKQVPRLGRWVDMDDDYRTMDASYTESVWWIFKSLYDKGLIYEGFKSMNLCPRCETTLSNFEVAQGYKDITDISVYVKFKLHDRRSPDKEGDAHLLAWTTTPWTLPGNAALAVNPLIEYVKIKIEEAEDQKKGLFILAKDRMAVLKDTKYSIIETFRGSQLVGLSYEPIFDYYSKDSKLKDHENGWKVYGADFVTTADGTGIVHIAPAFGADDYDLSLKEHLPFIQHVDVSGIFKGEATDFAGQHVKPIDTEEDKNAHQKADIEIIKWLAHHGFLFEKEKITHSYPHCWRCETPLLNYAASSWFVKVTAFKDELVKANRKVIWVPEEVGKYRFGNWLSEARDWAISRSRFWGAPIPVWKEKDKDGKTEKYHIIGSVEDLKRFSKAKNTYYVMRHGEAENNVKRILDSGERDKDNPSHLTEKGKAEVEKAAESLSANKFDLIFVSPLARTKETADVLKDKLGWKDGQIIIEDRIREMGMGEWNGKDIGDFYKNCLYEERFEKGAPGGETYTAIKKRMGDFLYDMESKYDGKNILIITHETPAFLLDAAAAGLDRKQSLAIRGKKDEFNSKDYIYNAEARKLDFTPLPHNEEYELDLHRPFIDNIELKSEEGNRLVRVQDVFDCWFESGSMPYGEAHYPFERDDFEPRSGLFHRTKGFPADFIAEGLDQTRGWFYSMIVLGVALFGKSPYKKVIVNGLVLAEDGQKMSKRKNNYPDPMRIVDIYGADSLRLYMMLSPVVHGQDLRFSERGVDEVTKKVFNRLLNVLSFYEMYADETKLKAPIARAGSENVLDRWIISRLDETVSAVTTGLEAGELDRASRPFLDFTDDLSTWYLRRSRDRFKTEGALKEAALATTKYILVTLAKLMAPFTPFFAEYLYREIGGEKESVHLDEWPEASGRITDQESRIMKDMETVRVICSKGLEARITAKVNVRQPLGTLKSQNTKLKELDPEMIALIKDEVNVKEVVFSSSMEKDVELDITITPELKEEGDLRELMRKIQDLRKEKGLKVGDRASLVVSAELKSLADKYGEEIKKATSLTNIEVGDVLKLS